MQNDSNMYYLDEFPPDDEITQKSVEAAKYMYIYLLPVLCVFGLIGNIISIFIFLSTLRKVSSNIYLAALSTTSSVFLVVLLFVWLEVVRVRLVHEHVICQCVVFITYVCSFLTVWFVAFITMENYIVTFHLKKAKYFCTVVKAKINVIVLSLVGICIYAISLWTSKVENFMGRKICITGPNHTNFVKIIMYIDTVVSLVIPSTIIVVLLSFIMCKQVWQHSASGCCFQRDCNRRLSKKERSLMRITRVLFAISVSYVLFSTPSCANRLRHIITTSIYGLNVTLKERAQNQIFQVIYYCSFCCNFVIYIFCCQNYRRGLKKLFKPVASLRLIGFGKLHPRVQHISNNHERNDVEVLHLSTV